MVSSFLLTLLVAEGGVRLYYLLKGRSSPPPIELDAELGWRSRPGVEAHYVPRDAANRSLVEIYGDVRYTTDERGFRAFGDPGTSRFKIFAIGDSFTQAKQVSDGGPYYEQLGRLRPDLFEIFAYGAGGYGSLQELMVMEAFVEEIAPDLILWQFSFNDLFNNDFLLESGSRERNNHMRRPYWEHGEVVYRHPDGGWAPWTRRSYLARRLRIYVDGIRRRTSGTFEQDLALEDPPFERALATTAALLQRAVDRAAPTPIVAFQASPLDRFGFEDKAFGRLCATVQELECVLDMLDVMRAARQSGREIDAGSRDGHWTREGHALAAERLLQHLVDAGHVPRQPATGNREVEAPSPSTTRSGIE